MTNPVTSDKVSTNLDIKGRNVDARPAANAGVDGEASRTDVRPNSPDSTDVGRASERLAQQLNVASEAHVLSASHAKALVAQLQLDIARDPEAVVVAFGKVNHDGFAAAIAEPSD